MVGRGIVQTTGTFSGNTTVPGVSRQRPRGRCHRLHHLLPVRVSDVQAQTLVDQHLWRLHGSGVGDLPSSELSEMALPFWCAAFRIVWLCRARSATTRGCY